MCPPHTHERAHTRARVYKSNTCLQLSGRISDIKTIPKISK
jgi:hypothetical protein